MPRNTLIVSYQNLLMAGGQTIKDLAASIQVHSLAQRGRRCLPSTVAYSPVVLNILPKQLDKSASGKRNCSSASTARQIHPVHKFWSVKLERSNKRVMLSDATRNEGSVGRCLGSSRTALITPCCWGEGSNLAGRRSRAPRSRGGGQAGAGSFTALDAFVKAITKSILPSPSVGDGLKAQLLADKATESLKNGQPVKSPSDGRIRN
jgi:hypothetical protein